MLIFKKKMFCAVRLTLLPIATPTGRLLFGQQWKFRSPTTALPRHTSAASSKYGHWISKNIRAYRIKASSTPSLRSWPWWSPLFAGFASTTKSTRSSSVHCLGISTNVSWMHSYVFLLLIVGNLLSEVRTALCSRADLRRHHHNDALRNVRLPSGSSIVSRKTRRLWTWWWLRQHSLVGEAPKGKLSAVPTKTPETQETTKIDCPTTGEHFEGETDCCVDSDASASLYESSVI